MNTNNMSKEQISAMVDNELTEAQAGVVLTALRRADERATWDVYHQIGDVLRSGEMAQPFSPDFAARLSARLEAEPAIVAPAAKQVSAQHSRMAAGGLASRTSNPAFKRFAMPVAVAAVAAAVFIASPQLMEALTGGARNRMAPIVAAKNDASSLNPTGAGSQSINAAASTPNGVILRDPRIDQYLLAHQRFSPSLYSTAQYARSATFASDSDK